MLSHFTDWAPEAQVGYLTQHHLAEKKLREVKKSTQGHLTSQPGVVRPQCVSPFLLPLCAINNGLLKQLASLNFRLELKHSSFSQFHLEVE